MQPVTIQAEPNQTFAALLGNQSCQINLTTRRTGLFIDLFVGNDPVIQGVICQDRNTLVKYAYLGFVGDLVFQDTQGTSDPEYTGLGSRYLLQYLEASDLP